MKNLFDILCFQLFRWARRKTDWDVGEEERLYDVLIMLLLLVMLVVTDVVFLLIAFDLFGVSTLSITSNDELVFKLVGIPLFLVAGYYFLKRIVMARGGEKGIQMRVRKSGFEVNRRTDILSFVMIGSPAVLFFSPVVYMTISTFLL